LLYQSFVTMRVELGAGGLRAGGLPPANADLETCSFYFGIKSDRLPYELDEGFRAGDPHFQRAFVSLCDALESNETNSPLHPEWRTSNCLMREFRDHVNLWTPRKFGGFPVPESEFPTAFRDFLYAAAHDIRVPSLGSASPPSPQATGGVRPPQVAAGPVSQPDGLTLIQDQLIQDFLDAFVPANFGLDPSDFNRVAYVKLSGLNSKFTSMDAKSSDALKAFIAEWEAWVDEWMPPDLRHFGWLTCSAWRFAGVQEALVQSALRSVIYTPTFCMIVSCARMRARRDVPMALASARAA
jgi:hypothetical protein